VAAPLQSDLAQSHNDIGFLLNETGHPAEALAALERARAIFQGLADANPAVTQFQGDLAQSDQVIGMVQDQTGRPAESLASLERARSILQKLVAANPRHALLQARLAQSHTNVGMARQQAGRPAEAAAEFRRAIAIMERLCDLQPDAYNLYNLACFRSSLSGIAVQPGSGLTAVDAGSLGQQAVDALRRAIAAGLQDYAFMRRDPDLDPLRSRPDFRALMMDLEFPEEPFAK
jgi:eukaryotic-like serine/threonine-protein kinase